MEKSLAEIEFETLHDVWIDVRYKGPLLTPDDHENKYAVFRRSKITGFTNWFDGRLANNPHYYRKPTEEEVKILAKIEYQRLLSEHSVSTPELITPAQKLSTSDQTETDDFIHHLKVEYSSDTSVILTPKGKQPKEYSCQQMGFKSTAKTWAMLVDILQMDDPQYHVGIYPKDKHRDKIKKYNSTMQIIKAFNKKFVAFLNNKYSAKIPDKFEVLKNQKGFDRDGTYRPIFRVVRLADESEVKINGISKEEWEREIKKLAENRRRERDPNKGARLLAQMGPYIKLGYKEGWLTLSQAQKYLDMNDENCSPEDALGDAGPLPGNI